MYRVLTALALSTLLALPAAAQPAQRTAALYDALRMGELLEIMREEGIGYGADLEADMFPGEGRGSWMGTVHRIYALDRLESEVRTGLEDELARADVEALVDFFSTPAGEKIVEHEIAARRALLDEAVEVAAREMWQQLEAEGSPRWALLAEFAEVNDLIESNVAGAMTSNYAFYMGLIDGGAFGNSMTEEQVLSDIWAQEQPIREETVDWVFSFTALAYQPLSDSEFADYVTFAQTLDGQALNAALFSVFNRLFAEISHDLGFEAARYMRGQDI